MLRDGTTTPQHLGGTGLAWEAISLLRSEFQDKVMCEFSMY